MPFSDVRAMRADMLPIAQLIAARGPLPPIWRLVGADDVGRAWACDRGEGAGLRIIETLARERDGRAWHHVSFSRAARTPTWDDVTLVKRLFIGEEVEAYQVLAPRSRWVNVHPHCLHLWACHDQPGGVLPDFRHLGQI